LAFSGMVGLLQSAISRTPGLNHPALALLGGCGVATGLVVWYLPWQRWRAKALEPLLPIAFLLLAGVQSVGANPAAVPPFFILGAVWAGLALPKGAGLRIAPLILVAHAGPLILTGRVETLVMTTIITVTVGVLVAEVVGRAFFALRVARAEAERMTEMMSVTFNAARRLRTLDTDGIYRELVEAVRSLGFDAAAVSVLEDNGSQFMVRAAQGFHAPVDGFVHLSSDGVAGRVLGSGKAVFIEDYQSSSLRVRTLDAEGFSLVAGIPVEVHGEIVAVLLACNRRQGELAGYLSDALSLLASDGAVALSNARDFEEQRELAREMTRRSLRDALTGLGNRRAADADLAAVRPGDAVLLIDLDHFKAVNDTDGHAAGDAVLANLGSFLGDSLRGSDTAARFGGEEFIVILWQAEREAPAIAERLLAEWRATRPRTTFSVGLAVHAERRTTEETLRMADTALYRAKRSGRDRLAIAGERRSFIAA
ncbi:MAG: sensor domain-containing diguanylate cyclase, partial [Acidobacteria bacterium]|nr:sensor domain-containing diguanylate cyclase [Acidobacteriota bacterium]